MKFGITTKLFLAILFTNVVIALAFAVANQVSVDRSFREYVHDREQRRLHLLSNDLASAYSEQGRSWDFLRNNDAVWRHVTRQDRGPPPPFPRVRTPEVPPAGSAVGRQDSAQTALPHLPPPPFREPGARERRDRFPAPPILAGGLPPWSFQLTLLDAQRTPVAGPPLSRDYDGLSQAIVVDGATVGWLVAQGPVAGADMRFLQQQLRNSWIIVAVAVLLATLVAVPLARGLLSPIRRLARATHRLASGDYAQRVATSRRDELGQLIHDFNQLAHTLQNAEQARRAFLADVSHELRTPLAILKGELEALEDGVRSLTPEAVKSLQAEVATLNGLVNDLYELAVSDLGAVMMNKERIDFADLVRTTLGAFRSRFGERDLTIDDAAISKQALHVQGDPRRLVQVINNLLENSLRYTDPAGLVEIIVKRIKNEVCFDVQDTAPAVAPDLMPRLCDRLFRVESSRNRSHGGAGLGLSICQSIVQAHGGVLTVRPSKLGGLWVQVRLPVLPD